jgi:HPt (histidine-containing phosphotransfer) domain-containing protein
MNTTPIDMNKALDELGNDKDFVIELINDLLSQIPEQMLSIREGIRINNCELVWRQAHTIKGGAGNIAATAIADIAFKIELAGKEGNIALCNDLIVTLESEVEKLKEFIKTI